MLGIHDSFQMEGEEERKECMYRRKNVSCLRGKNLHYEGKREAPNPLGVPVPRPLLLLLNRLN